MSDIVIQVENLGKSYIIGHEKQEHYTALRDVLTNKVKKIISKSGQILRGEQLIAGNELEEFWALKDINFELKQGDRLGIIGRNGAGKSTLLKVLSRITEPTKGKVKMKGRVSSLLEVGTGFHPELTGRENIFLNGAILGMNRGEIKKKFDEIVDFSGVEKFLDTPVKRYSSGMYVRLAFSVAANLESDVLIVDEVLAVGDSDFQKKCLGKMEDISTSEGRTILFVSHNMTAIKGLCKTGIWLKDGMIHKTGEVNPIVQDYLTQGRQSLTDLDLTNRTDFKYSGKLRMGKVNIYSNALDRGNILNTEKVTLQMQILNPKNYKGNLELAGTIRNEESVYIHYFSSKLKSKIYKVNGEKEFTITVVFDNLPLNQGDYFLGFEIKFQSEIVYWIDESIKFSVFDNDFYNSGVAWDSGLILIKQEWL